MAALIEKENPGAVVELVEGGRGDFIVIRDGEVLWDKRGRDGRFPADDEILGRLGH